MEWWGALLGMWWSRGAYASPQFMWSATVLSAMQVGCKLQWVKVMATVFFFKPQPLSQLVSDWVSK